MNVTLLHALEENYLFLLPKLPHTNQIFSWFKKKKRESEVFVSKSVKYG